MRDPDRIPMILSALERRWSQDPDLRLGQLIMVLLRKNRCLPDPLEGKALFGVPDGELLAWIGAATDAEATYVRDEPQKEREGWREWMRASRESGGRGANDSET